MKVTFLLDNNEYIELTPETLQIRQLQPGVAALGTEVTVPVLAEDGKTQLKNDDGTPKTAIGFRPFINYAVNLTIPYASLEAEIEALKKQLGDKLAQQTAEKLAAEAPVATAVATAVPTPGPEVQPVPTKKSKRKAN
jgi:hypothetical protein